MTATPIWFRFAVLVILVACGGKGPVTPTQTTNCYARPVVAGFEADRTGLTDNLGVSVKVTQRTRIRFTVGKTLSTDSCGSELHFRYMKWTWNYRPPADRSTEPRLGPLDVGVASCMCRLFGPAQWIVPETGGAPHWEQRAWLDGEQTLEMDVRGVSPGSAVFFVTAFVDGPYPNPPNSDGAIYVQHLLVGNVTP